MSKRTLQQLEDVEQTSSLTKVNIYNAKEILIDMCDNLERMENNDLRNREDIEYIQRITNCIFPTRHYPDLITRQLLQETLKYVRIAIGETSDNAHIIIKGEERTTFSYLKPFKSLATYECFMCYSGIPHAIIKRLGDYTGYYKSICDSSKFPPIKKNDSQQDISKILKLDVRRRVIITRSCADQRFVFPAAIVMQFPESVIKVASHSRFWLSEQILFYVDPPNEE